jgi:phosphoglycerol transferase MdoB-like AlkP superfamily enzyme
MIIHLWIFEIITILIYGLLLFIVLKFFIKDRNKLKKIFNLIASLLIILYLFYTIIGHYYVMDGKMFLNS